MNNMKIMNNVYFTSIMNIMYNKNIMNIINIISNINIMNIEIFFLYIRNI